MADSRGERRSALAWGGAPVIGDHTAGAAIDPLLDDKEVARIIGRARSTLQEDRLVGGGIPFVRLGRLIRYRSSDVSAYLASLPTLSSTSEAA